MKSFENKILEHFFKKGIFLNIVSAGESYKHFNLDEKYSHNYSYFEYMELSNDSDPMIQIIYKHYDNIYYCFKFDDHKEDKIRIRYLINNDRITFGFLGGYMDINSSLIMMKGDFPLIYKDVIMKSTIVAGNSILGKNDKVGTTMIYRSRIRNSTIIEGHVESSSIYESTMYKECQIYDSNIEEIICRDITGIRDSDVYHCDFMSNCCIINTNVGFLYSHDIVRLHQYKKVFVNGNKSHVLYYNTVGKYKNINVYIGNDQIYISINNNIGMINNNIGMSLPDIKKYIKNDNTLERNDRRFMLSFLKYIKKHFNCNRNGFVKEQK